MPLSSKSFGLAGGILVSLTLFGISWHVILTDLGNEFVKIWEDMHFWYKVIPLASPEGSLIALGDGFVFLFIFAWLYNWFERRKI